MFLLFFACFCRLYACGPSRASGFDSFLQVAQQTVSGVVREGDAPLPGVTVSVQGKPGGVVTDDEGRFEIAAAPGDVLLFSYLGYSQVSVEVGAQASYSVSMVPDATTLQEVAVNAGYYSVKERERTGSISRITAKDIENQPVSNVLAAMQGRLPGVSITQTTGTPGGGFEVFVRGQNSIRTGGNSPLYVIDDVPYSSENLGFGTSTVVLPAPANPLNSINPSDVESIDVLKDADATAIYGSRGANGVILVTTRRAKAGKMRLEAGLRTGTGSVTRFMDLMDTSQYLAMRDAAFVNDGIEPGPTDYDVNGTWSRERYTNWQEELLGGSANFTDARLSLSGGSQQTRFLASGNFYKETTVTPGDFRYKKGNFLLNVHHESQDGRAKAGFTAGYTAQDNFQPGMDLSRTAVLLAPNAPALFNGDGSLNWENSTWENPLAVLLGHYRADTRDVIASGNLSYSLFPGFVAKTTLGLTDTKHYETRIQPSTMYDPAFEAGSEFSTINATTTNRRSWIVEPQVEWGRQWGRGRLELLAGTTLQQQVGRQLVQEGYGFTSNSLIYNLAMATDVLVPQDNESVYRYQAAFGRANYNYDGRLLLNVTGRRDGSSRFGPGRQFAGFGAVGAAWVFSREGFMQKLPVLSFGKVRASYGTSGNDQIGDYQFLETYSASGASYNGIGGLHPTRLYNPNFGWEVNKKIEVGLELGFFRDRVFFTGSWFRNRSSSQLVGIPLPATTGFSSLQANLDAEVQNRGLEFTLRTQNIDRAFKWVTSANLSSMRNKLLSFPNLEGSTYRNQLVIGEALNIRKVYEYTGQDPLTGLYTFRDFNGDGVISAPDDKQVVRDFNPRFFGGLQNDFSYHGWNLGVFFQFVSQENYSAQFMAGLPGTMVNQPASAAGAWQQPGDASGLQPYTTGVNSDASTAYTRFKESDAAIVDASFIRLKSLALSYDLPASWLKGIKCRLSLEGQNLLLFTPYKGRDPEFRTTGYLPPLRVITTGINLTL